MSKSAGKRISFLSRRDHRVFLVCFLIAFLFWFAIKFSRNYTHNYDFTVHYILPDTLSFSELPPDRLRVQLEGSGWDLMKFSFRKDFTTIAIRTSESSVSQTELVHAIEQHIDDASISVEKVSEANLNLSIEDRMDKMVPVEPEVSYTLARGYTLKGSILVEPDSIRIQGPVSVVTGIGSWPTGPVEGIDLSNDVKMVVKLLPPENDAITLSTTTVDLTIPVERLTEKVVKVPIRLTGDSLHSFRVYPTAVTITCVVGMSRYNDLKSELFRVEARIKSNRNLTERHIPVEVVEFPEYLSGIDYQPKTVEVLRMEKPDASRAPGD